MGKTAVITGGSKGIGKETAVLFAKNGYNVAICARDEPSLRKAADELTKTNKNIFYQKCDVSKSNDVTDFAANTIKKFGSIDVLVNNAGIFDLALLGDTSEKMWDDMININLKGMFLMTKEVLPVMLKNKKGHIINISSAYRAECMIPYIIPSRIISINLSNTAKYNRIFYAISISVKHSCIV